jgi:hypothetical protein
LGAALLLIGATACARSTIAHTPGEIPRDTYGKPVWSLIEPSVPRPAGT